MQQLCRQAEKVTLQGEQPQWFCDMREQLRKYHCYLNDEVLDRKDQLQQGEQTWTQRQQSLDREQQRLAHWAQQQEQLIEQRSAQVAMRESELGRLHYEYQQQKQAWVKRRRTQQRRLRRLLAA